MAIWSGLGITANQPHGSWHLFTSSTHVEIGSNLWPQIVQFPRLRMIVQQESSSSQTALRLWASDIKTFNPSTYILYGIANSSTVYLPTFYSTYLTSMLAEAQWAQDNGMDQFQVANEFEVSFHRGTLGVTSITRSSNVSTAVTSSAHGLVTGDTIIITGSSPSSFNVSQVACTVIDSTTFTYANAGTDGSASGTILLGCGDLTIVRLVKALATAAQAVFTRGPISYSFSQGYQAYWTSINPGTDLDLIGLDVYGSNSTKDSFDDWKSIVDTVFATFGTQMFISEFNLHASWGSSLACGFGPTCSIFDPYYADEAYRRMKYARSIGIQQAYFFAAWNASASENNNFTAWYNTNTITGAVDGAVLQGGWKSVYDRLLEQRISHLFLGTQQHT